MPLRPLIRLAPMLCLLITVPAGAVEELRWKFAAGDTHQYELNQTTTTTAMVQNQEVKTTITQTVEMAWEVEEVNDDGSARMAQTIERVRVALESQFANFAYDSGAEQADGDGPAAMLKPVIDALVGARVVLVMTPQGEVNDVEVPADMVERLRNAGPAAQALQNLATAEGMKGLIGQSTLVLPDTIEQDGSWTREVDLPTPQGVMKLVNTFTFKGGDTSDEKIDMVTEIQGFDVAPDAPFEMRVDSQEGTGTFSFNNEEGRLSSSEVKQNLKAVISVEDQEITSTSESTATFTRTGD